MNYVLRRRLSQQRLVKELQWIFRFRGFEWDPSGRLLNYVFHDSRPPHRGLP